MKPITTDTYDFETYLASGKPVVLIGANFNSDTRNLDGYVVERL